jgi:UDP-N-acetylglucosamine diphosphorylase/glucosamine-1-phosphate N-acetyltransferase
MPNPNYVLFDPDFRNRLLPLTFTRPVSLIRTGILTIAEKWANALGSPVSHLTADYLQAKFTLILEEENILINGGLIPDSNLNKAIMALNAGQSLWKGDLLLAAVVEKSSVQNFSTSDISQNQASVKYEGKISLIDRLWKIYTGNGNAIQNDLALLHLKPNPGALPENNILIGDNIYIEEGAKVNASIINTENGPVYIGKSAEMMEGCKIRGPFVLGDHSVLKMGTKIYGPTTIGPHSKVGGEVNNSVIFGYSNKAHDGFLGNAVVGEWCNLGADTNNSNLKNNYAEVRLWDYEQRKFLPTSLQFCGLIMGDHSKCAINTMFNTGTVVGVSANIFGAGFPRNFIPSFSWGGANKMSVYQINKALEVAEIVMSRRGIELTEADKNILQYIFEVTEMYRKF